MVEVPVGAGQNVLCNSGIAFGAAFLASGCVLMSRRWDLRMWLTVFERLRLAVSILPQVPQITDGTADGCDTARNQ